jgi:penicillin V acylase-like amidase (Ntn superfamily)
MKTTLFLFALILLLDRASACTCFLVNKNGQLLFGRNYDWVTGNGMTCTNQRGLHKTSYPNSDGGTIDWTSRYGSITFNQYGKEFPTGGMNEKGLVVELMWMDGSRYPEPDQRPSLGVLQWIQFQLDNCHTVEEVIASDTRIRISSVAGTPLHYLVADATGKAASIEFLDGKMVVHTGASLPFPVLTNTAYSESLQETGFKTASASPGYKGFSKSSTGRFANACYRLKEFLQPDIAGNPLAFSFGLLNEVAQGNTKWSIIYDIANRKIYFKTTNQPVQKEISFSAFDFTCSNQSKYWSLDRNESGNIAGYFSDFSLTVNEKTIRKSCDETASQFLISEETRKKAAAYPAGISCR